MTRILWLDGMTERGHPAECKRQGKYPVRTQNCYFSGNAFRSRTAIIAIHRRVLHPISLFAPVASNRPSWSLDIFSPIQQSLVPWLFHRLPPRNFLPLLDISVLALRLLDQASDTGKKEKMVPRLGPCRIASASIAFPEHVLREVAPGLKTSNE